MLEGEEKKINFKTYIIGFILFSFSAVVSFFVGFKLGKSMAKEEFRKEVLKTKETELEDVLQRIFEKAEQKAAQEEAQITPQETEKKEMNQETEKKEINKTEELQQTAKTEESIQQAKIIKAEETIQNTEEKQPKESTEKQTPEKAAEFINEKEEKTETKPTKSKIQQNGKAVSLKGKNLWESGGKWTVQIASFDTQQKASKYAEEIKRKYGLPSYTVKATKNGKVVWRVRVGKTKDKKTAEEIREFLKSKGIEGIVTF
ncbi:MAG: SPOR domain-containing protein [Candidatus Calescibacterium sp.]|nr:SPOR domain-containing protein [Candidatus Calescibacterium sp.]MCX7733143.1 SPOR domain-containing protein [bacterium]MDW8087697.1 SPOR domain-containing protein [Candidatus Calescibacterium sp.]